MSPGRLAADLREILELTQRALAGPFGEAEALQLLDARRSLVDRATRARLAGGAWGAEEDRLAAELRELDRRAMERLSAPLADARSWLATRGG